jgi:hypothetical protein
LTQSIERHQLEVPVASFAAAAQQLKVLQMDNVRLTAQVSKRKKFQNMLTVMLTVRLTAQAGGRTYVAARGLADT